eukprot:TRINITY_DN22802_c0_g1_i1.p1 TRINITY_DN22802_c0_g1~~TRINITY_DN22802_c0_g1_i1.p1  ORF type:complete len:375 (-),score=110.85 TRINITY_DN22802_c0_g1_i1:58-1086(-)
METVGDRIAKAQESGDPAQIRAALLDAKASGADPAQIDQALAELDRAEAAGGSASSGQQAGYPDDPNKILELRAKAEAFKKKGNEALKAGTKTGAREALDFFTTGLEVRCSDPVLNAQLYSNRAHVRMLLRQFVEAVDDCRKAIAADPKNIKAYWRAAKASLHLDLCRNGIDFCEEGLKHGPDADLTKLRDACAEKLQGQQQRRAQRSADSSAAMPMNPDFNADEAMAVQEKVQGLAEQLESIKASIGNKKRQKMRLQLTRESVVETPPETKLYRSVGRCFLLGERSNLEETMKTTLESIDQELPKLEKTSQELEKRKADAEKELREMVTAFTQKTSAASAV